MSSPLLSRPYFEAFIAEIAHAQKTPLTVIDVVDLADRFHHRADHLLISELWAAVRDQAAPSAPVVSIRSRGRA